MFKLSVKVRIPLKDKHPQIITLTFRWEGRHIKSERLTSSPFLQIWIQFWSNNYLTFIKIYIFPPVWINSLVASFPTPCHPLFTVDFANGDTLFCSSQFVTFRCKFPSDSSTAERMIFIVIKFGCYFLQNCVTIFFSSRAVKNFRLPFRGWFSTVQVDHIYSQHCQLLTRVCPINQKYTTFSPFPYIILRSILWFLLSLLCFCDPSRLCAFNRR